MKPLVDRAIVATLHLVIGGMLVACAFRATWCADRPAFALPFECLMLAGGLFAVWTGVAALRGRWF